MAIESLQQQIPYEGDMVPVISTAELMDGMRELPLEQKLSGSLKLMGAEFWDEDLRYVRDNAVSLCGLGGIPVAECGESVDNIQHRLLQSVARGYVTMELSAAFSYLNSRNLGQGELYDLVAEFGHFSIAHTVTANVLVAGLTTAVECEFDTQRDMIHLSRVTVARTRIQTQPPIVAPDEASYELTRRITENTQALLDEARSPKSNRDENEVLNRLFPASKATALMLTGSLRSFSKLVDQRTDTGKELEYRDILTKLHGMFGTIWPEMFKND